MQLGFHWQKLSQRLIQWQVDHLQLHVRNFLRCWTISRCEHPKLAHNAQNQTFEYVNVAISNHPNLNCKISPQHASDLSKCPIAQSDWSPTQLHPTHPSRWMTHSQHIGHHWSTEPTSPDVKLRLGLSSCCMSGVGFLEIVTTSMNINKVFDLPTGESPSKW